MADKRAWPDNVFVERLWRSVKYEKVAKGLRDFHVSIGRYKRFYNTGTAYSSFDRKTADQA
jgi:putative transposase